MSVHDHGNRVVVAVHHRVLGGVNLKHPLGDHEPDVFFLLNGLRIFARVHLQN